MVRKIWRFFALSRFEQGMLAGVCAVITCLTPFVAARYPEITEGKWVITGIADATWLLVMFKGAWDEVKERQK
ncbi:hypothetical protein [Candidatus Magnetobacterium casense]|uniref:Uncharacterized protein n=1 Tax=Candidatus Magnetobacterium casense TaxID=1455061 RepID=A0ABS6RXW5_9BACT|nr:hypothetical protein [Candidatus Magnetobacterium casensis]MBV6341474.1 hypothetical protein [Candidatus Magnetobacterium casensis]